MKSIIKNYYAPTPAKFRKLGDALLGAGTTMATFAICSDMKALAIIAMGLGTTGKFLTNFFTEDGQA